MVNLFKNFEKKMKTTKKVSEDQDDERREKESQNLKKTRGKVYVKYNPKAKPKKRIAGILKKLRELFIIYGLEGLLILKDKSGKYKSWVSHAVFLHNFDPSKILPPVVGNPAIYAEWTREKGDKDSHREYMPMTVSNEKNPSLSDEKYIDYCAAKFIEREMNLNF